MAIASPTASVVFSFDAHLLDVTANDASLEAYGFAPVSSPFIPMYGVRGAFEWPSRVRVGLTASHGFISARADHTPVPTTTNQTRIAATVGFRAHRFVAAEADVGFAALTHTVGSESGGGALVYLGPSLQPRVSFVALDAPSWLSVTAGYSLQLAVGSAHAQPLWEEPFSNRLVHGPVISVQSGMGTN